MLFLITLTARCLHLSTASEPKFTLSLAKEEHDWALYRRFFVKRPGIGMHNRLCTCQVDIYWFIYNNVGLE